MGKSAKLRWTGLLSALFATIVAIFYPVDETSGKYPARRAPISTVSAPTAEKDKAPAARALWIASDENPFAPRVWQAPLPVSQPIAAAQPAESSAQPAVEPPPPPLPYRFLGQMQDGDKRVLYLGHGEQVLLAHQGDVLESSYKVVSISDGQIEFESVQSGTRQTLPIPAQ